MGTNSSKKIKNNNSNEKNESIKTKLVLIRIPIRADIWEKTFNIEETLEKVANDFKNEKDLNTLNNNYFIEWTFNNSPIKMNSKKLKDFIEEKNLDSFSIKFNQEIKLKIGHKLNNIDIYEMIGKPLYNPFEIFIFEINQKSIKIKAYNKTMVWKSKLDKFSIDSSYCNGNNHLFISGGTDPITRTILDLFWDIDLRSEDLSSPLQMSPKKNHSMIYINKKVFIVGGDDEKTLVYDIESKDISNLCNLTIKRFEPSLIRHDNYLYCFDSQRKKNDDRFSLERINLNDLGKSCWEIIYPNISPLLKDNVYNQKFFGVVEDYNQNILFIGGIYGNLNSQNNGDNKGKKNIMNTRYNIIKNTIEKSDILFEEISFSEKTFLSIDDKIYFILPNFSKRAPKIVYYNKDKNETYISSYKKKNNYINPNSQIKAYLFNINLDMPGLNKEIDLNMNTNSTDFNIIGSNFNNDITMKNPNLFQIGSSITHFDENNPSAFKIKGGYSINKMNSILLETDFNKSVNPNIENNIKNKNYELNGGYKWNAIDNMNNNNLKLELDKNPINEKNNLDQINIGMNITPNNINIEHNNGINKISDNNDINDVKINMIKDNIPVTNSKKPNYERFYNQNSKNKFHNSVDDPCNIIKKIKVKKLSNPKYISPKLIKKKVNEILKAERNRPRINNY